MVNEYKKLNLDEQQKKVLRITDNNIGDVYLQCKFVQHKIQNLNEIEDPNSTLSQMLHYTEVSTKSMEGINTILLKEFVDHEESIPGNKLNGTLSKNIAHAKGLVNLDPENQPEHMCAFLRLNQNG